MIQQMITTAIGKRSPKLTQDIINYIVDSDENIDSDFDRDKDSMFNVGFLSMVIDTLPMSVRILQYISKRIRHAEYCDNMALSNLDLALIICAIKCGAHRSPVILEDLGRHIRIEMERYESLLTMYGSTGIDNDMEYFGDTDVNDHIFNSLVVFKDGHKVEEECDVMVVDEETVTVCGSDIGVSVKKPLSSILDDGTMDHLLSNDFDNTLPMMIAFAILIYDLDKAKAVLSYIFDDDIYYITDGELTQFVKGLRGTMMEMRDCYSIVSDTYLLDTVIKIIDETKGDD